MQPQELRDLFAKYFPEHLAQVTEVTAEWADFMASEKVDDERVESGEKVHAVISAPLREVFCWDVLEVGLNNELTDSRRLDKIGKFIEEVLLTGDPEARRILVDYAGTLLMFKWDVIKEYLGPKGRRLVMDLIDSGHF